jgi:hypothetical protein
MTFKTFFAGSLLAWLAAASADFACADEGGTPAAGAGAGSTSGSGTRATSTTTGGGGTSGTGDTTAGAGGSDGSGGTSGTGDATAGAGGSGGSGETTAGSGGARTTGGTGGVGTTGGTGGVRTDGGGGTAGTRLDAGVGGSSGSGGSGTADCASTPGLVWKTANKINFASYPPPNSEECIKYNGCPFVGMFSACAPKQEPLSWVMSHNIASLFPNFNAYKLHDLCLKSSAGKTIVVTVLETCADSDCSGCCTADKGNADALVDLEKYTNDRWGVPDGGIMWADLGPTKGSGCN